MTATVAMGTDFSNADLRSAKMFSMHEAFDANFNGADLAGCAVTDNQFRRGSFVGQRPPR